MSIESNHGAFDKDEQAILSAIVPEVDPVEEVVTDQPGEATAQPAAATTTATETPSVEEATKPAEAATTTEAATITTEATQAATTEQPQGDPRAALRASRRSEKRLRDELDQLKQENEALKQGKGPVDTSITDAELEQLETDFPLQAKIVRKQREIEQQLVQAKPTEKQPEFEPMSYDPAVQEVIDGVPDLMAWQYDPAAQDKFQRAIAYDKALSVDPDWQGKTIAERFSEAARRTKVAMAPAAPTPAAPAAPRNDPAAVIAAAPVAGPKGISDFKGGAPANAPTVNYQGMSDEQIMASLPTS